MDMLIGNSENIFRIIVTGVLSYFLLIFIIRFNGKRTLSKMNAFDIIITVSLGSMLATIILDSSISLLEGMVAMTLMILMQYVITWTSVRSDIVKKVIKSDPTLLLYNGEFHEKKMAKERVLKEELEQAIRNGGYSDFSDVKAIILESDGSFSVLSDNGRQIQKLTE